MNPIDFTGTGDGRLPEEFMKSSSETPATWGRALPEALEIAPGSTRVLHTEKVQTAMRAGMV